MYLGEMLCRENLASHEKVSCKSLSFVVFYTTWKVSSKCLSLLEKSKVSSRGFFIKASISKGYRLSAA